MTGFERGHIDSSQVVQTPEGVEFVLYPAGLPVRMCAGMIDSAIQGIFVISLWIAFYFLDWVSITGQWVLLLLIFSVDWFYHVISEVFFKGQSPGKRLMGIRVVRMDGAPVNVGASFLRNLLRFADTFLLLYLIVLLCIAVSRGFRRLGDWAAGTLVVYTSQAQTLVRQTAMPWLQTAAVSPSRRLSYEEKQGILMFARRYPLLGKSRADEIAGGYTEYLRGGKPGEPVSGSEYLLGIARRLSGDEGPGEVLQ